MSRWLKLLSLPALLLLLKTPAGAQIDPSIILRGQPVQIESPLDAVLKAQQVKLQQQELLLQQQEIQRQQEELERQRETHARDSSPAARGAGLKVPPLSSLMKPDKFVAAGLSRLSSAEMAQLDSWMGGFLDAYTKILYDEFVTQTPATSDLDAQTESIEEVSDDGERIRLLDGSAWQVRTGESVRSSLWLAASEVTVVRGSGSDKALLIHDDQVVHAVRTK